MKGFPNQIADFRKLAKGMQVAAGLSGRDAKNNATYGAALVQAGVAGTGHKAQPIEQYLREQNEKPVGSQGHRTAARGLRELYRKLGLIEDAGSELKVTALGYQAASFAEKAFDNNQATFWRTALTSMTLGEVDHISHPYQVLLRLVAAMPGIPRAKCALALEAVDDSTVELTRIHDLAALDEAEIRQRINVTLSNWNNAKKMLPRFAEQLGDVIRVDGGYTLGHNPGAIAPTRNSSIVTTPSQARRLPRSSRRVTPETIARAGLADRSEPAPPPDLNLAQMAAAIATRADRVSRHNELVRELAKRLNASGHLLYEDPFDVLATSDVDAFLIEVKTLDGSIADERDRVRDALAQLLYYEAFVAEPHAAGLRMTKIACFESKPSDAHIEWLSRTDIRTVWYSQDTFVAIDLDVEWLGLRPIAE